MGEVSRSVFDVLSELCGWPFIAFELADIAYRLDGDRLFLQEGERLRYLSSYELRTPFDCPWRIVLIDFGEMRRSRVIVRKHLYYLTSRTQRARGRLPCPVERVLFLCTHRGDRCVLIHATGRSANSASLAEIDFDIGEPDQDTLSRLKNLEWGDFDRWHQVFEGLEYTFNRSPQNRSRYDYEFYSEECPSILSLRSKHDRAAILDRGEERALIAMAQEGNEWALRKLVEGNLDWAIESATRAWTRYRFMNVPLEDVVSDAVIALIETIHRFDLTYPGSLKQNWQWLSRCVSRSVVELRYPIYYPYYLYGQKKRITRVATPTYRLLDSERYQVVKRGMRIGKVLQSEDPVCPERRLIQLESLEAVLAILSPREREVLRLRFGIDPRCQDRELTLETVGQLLSVTRERVRQVEMRAMKRLRAYRKEFEATFSELTG